MLTRSPTAIASAPPLPPSPVTVTTIGVAQPRHLAQVAGDRLGLAALLGVEARVGARRVHEAEDRPAELRGELHHAQRLAIALGLRHAEVAVDLLLGVAALLVADDRHRPVAEEREAADERRVVREAPVAVELGPLREERLDVVERVGPVRVARDQRLLPGRELRVDLAPARVELLAQALAPRAPWPDRPGRGELVDAASAARRAAPRSRPRPRARFPLRARQTSLRGPFVRASTRAPGRAAPRPRRAAPRRAAPGSRRWARAPPRTLPGARSRASPGIRRDGRRVYRGAARP